MEIQGPELNVSQSSQPPSANLVCIFRVCSVCRLTLLTGEVPPQNLLPQAFLGVPFSPVSREARVLLPGQCILSVQDAEVTYSIS